MGIRLWLAATDEAHAMPIFHDQFHDDQANQHGQPRQLNMVENYNEA